MIDEMLSPKRKILTITIAGSAGTGKSSFAQEVSFLCERHNIPFELIDGGPFLDKYIVYNALNSLGKSNSVQVRIVTKNR